MTPKERFYACFASPSDAESYEAWVLRVWQEDDVVPPTGDDYWIAMECFYRDDDDETAPAR